MPEESKIKTSNNYLKAAATEFLQWIFFAFTFSRISRIAVTECDPFWAIAERECLEIFATKFPDVMGSYRRLSYRILSCIVISFLYPHFWANCFMLVVHQSQLSTIEY